MARRRKTGALQFWIGTGLGLLVSASAVAIAAEFTYLRRQRRLRTGMLDDSEETLVHDLSAAVHSGIEHISHAAAELAHSFSDARRELVRLGLEPLAGGHDAQCHIFDPAGKKVKSFKGGRSHFQNWIDAIRSGKQEPGHSAASGHLSSALAHIGNISQSLGEPVLSRLGVEAFAHPAAAEAVERMDAHLVDNGVDVKKHGIRLGAKLAVSGEKFTGDHADKANALLKGSYRKGFELPG